MNKLKYFFAKVLVRLVTKLKQQYQNITVYCLKTEFRRLGTNAHIEPGFHVMNPQCISIGNNFTARARVTLRAYTSWDDTPFTPNLTIGNNVHIATDVVINCTHSIEICDNSAIGVGAKIMDHTHGRSDHGDLSMHILKKPLTSKGGVRIKENVFIGTGVVIMEGIEIGENSIIGSNAVVTRSIPPNSIAAGIPARVLKTISPK